MCVSPDPAKYRLMAAEAFRSLATPQILAHAGAVGFGLAGSGPQRRANYGRCMGRHADVLPE